MSNLSYDRIQFFLSRLRDEKTKASDRLKCLKLISDAALNEYWAELGKLDALNVVHADPAITALTGVPIE